MPVEINFDGQNYFLQGECDGLFLRIDCHARIKVYNAAHPRHQVDGYDGHAVYPIIEDDLYAAFEAADDVAQLAGPVTCLSQAYGLLRHPVLIDHVNGLFPQLVAVRDQAPAERGNLHEICAQFREIKNNPQVAVTVDVSLSKFLHFCNRRRFWIIDSTVKTILRIWGYGQSFDGFAAMLGDLMANQQWDDFVRWLMVINQQGDPCQEPSTLKVLDKALFG